MDGERANPNHLNQDILLERVEKVYSDGKWNGRAEIAFWNDLTTCRFAQVRSTSRRTARS